MSPLYRCMIGWVLALGGGLCFSADGHPQPPAQMVEIARKLVGLLSSHCPMADPASEKAFSDCRQRLYRDETWRHYLPDFVLWGRQRHSVMTLKDSTLTQFGPDVFTGMYLPLFMFSGQYQVLWIEHENRYQIRAKAAFRSRLPPGQFPYPFWHEADKWSMYQRASDILLWWDADKQRILAAQFAAPASEGSTPNEGQLSTPHFDGRWMWTDEQGRTQPMVTLFDGLFDPRNPYLKPLDQAYKTLALRLRESQCNDCHVPSNPNKMKRLVLFQTPAHAGAEIQRLIQSIKKDRMPIDETGIEQPLSLAEKNALLRDSEDFGRLYDEAKKWERGLPHEVVSGRVTP